MIVLAEAEEVRLVMVASSESRVTLLADVTEDATDTDAVVVSEADAAGGGGEDCSLSMMELRMLCALSVSPDERALSRLSRSVSRGFVPDAPAEADSVL